MLIHERLKDAAYDLFVGSPSDTHYVTLIGEYEVGFEVGVDELWALKTYLRCKLYSGGAKRYVFGAGGKGRAFMSRIHLVPTRDSNTGSTKLKVYYIGKVLDKGTLELLRDVFNRVFVEEQGRGEVSGFIEAYRCFRRGGGVDTDKLRSYLGDCVK
ncbi:hypothetical protein B9Q06_05820 [Candidatus Marsarchaeota G2 archaeon ECH_B_2]|uniref:Uncharacterized protein n=3 Tax=Candidatus Marsarchaeota group 2 TaxID=2203771 RepID=A0A2R6B9W8_9ARCH|nr:MAG: hypothetical protein B9Q06_05820 [Candidatus Marsarchaeota G2 archaeon ECH_B_2]PSN98296.1 MAG: hypothetical protein B9Q07_10140 [Candidatus Marsarchaeota G2 archaeon ECH_B_3]PSO00008.1 MAG: hypothetical protein B9Q05_11030 [Candidatus Marsarchaeota G2 archaeon ECH_B_1]